jgi:hypothetical protein
MELQCELLLPQTVRVLRSAHSADWYIINALLLNQACMIRPPLQANDVWVQVDVDGDGRAYLVSEEDEVAWVDDLVATVAYRSQKGVVANTRIANGTKHKLLTEMMRKHAAVDVTLTVPELAADSLSIQAGIFASVCDGARTYLDIFAVYSKLGLTLYPGSASTWFQKRRPTFIRIADRFSLGQHAVRFCVPWKDADADAFPDKCLSFNGLSVQLVLASFSAMAFSESKQAGGVTDVVNATKLRAFLGALLAMTPSSWSLRLVLSIDSMWIPGIGIAGVNPVTLPVIDGCVDLAPFHAGVQSCRDPTMPGVGVLAGMTACPLIELLQHTASTLALCWLFKQLVWAVGTEIDNRICYSLVRHARSADADDDAVSVCRSQVMGGSELHCKRELNKYYKKAVRVMQPSKFFSFAPDGGKIGNRNKVICPIADHESKQVMWAVPQDRFVLFRAFSTGVPPWAKICSKTYQNPC